MTTHWTDMLTFTVAALAALECIVGRLAAMHVGEHRPAYLIGYLLAVGICILAASLIWQGADAGLLDMAAWGVAAHLALTWRDWRHRAPPWACRQPMQLAPLALDSRQDDGR